MLLFPLQVYPPIPFGKGVGSGGVQVNGCVAFSCLLGYTVTQLLELTGLAVFSQHNTCHISLRFQSLENSYAENLLFVEEASYLLRNLTSSEHTIFNGNTSKRPHAVL